jgi:hypothetical protein
MNGIDTTTTVSEQCRKCLMTLKSTLSALSDSEQERCVSHKQVNEEYERLGLWAGNIGALHRQESPLSMESRLKEASDVLSHVFELLDSLDEVTNACEYEAAILCEIY